MSMPARSRVFRKSRRRRGGRGDGELLPQPANIQALVQRARQDPHGLSKDQALQLQRTVGNQQSSALLGEGPEEREGSRKGPVPYAEATEAERNQRLEAYIQSHHERTAWLEGMHGGLSEEEALKHLAQNFFERKDFEYNFTENKPFEGKGDCETLLTEFRLVAWEALGIKLEQRDLEGFIFIEGGGRIIDKQLKTGNVDHGAHWVFEKHHWLLWQGKPVDLLFGMFGELKKAVEGKEVKDQVTAQLNFADTTVYAASDRGPDNLFTLEEAKALRLSSHKD